MVWAQLAAVSSWQPRQLLGSWCSWATGASGQHEQHLHRHGPSLTLQQSQTLWVYGSWLLQSVPATFARSCLLLLCYH